MHRPPPIVTKDTAVRQHAADDDDVSMESWDDVAETNAQDDGIVLTMTAKIMMIDLRR